jgi:hypothetical protein
MAERRATGKPVRGFAPRAIAEAAVKFCPPDRDPSEFEQSLANLINRSGRKPAT